MRTGLYQQQLQKAIQQQRLTASQMIQVKLLEMPLAQLEETVNAELDDNPALETLSDNEYAENNDNAENADALETYEQQTEREERADAIDAALDNIDSDDRLPNYEKEHITNYAADYEEMVYGDTVSFYDYLKEQMGETSLNEQEQDVLEYLIGSLDNDGLLRKDLATISDELAIYNNIYVDEKEIGRMLAVLQTFDPAGIGARTLQECLMIQIERKMRQLAAEKKKQRCIRCTDKPEKHNKKILRPIQKKELEAHSRENAPELRQPESRTAGSAEAEPATRCRSRRNNRTQPATDIA